MGIVACGSVFKTRKYDWVFTSNEGQGQPTCKHRRAVSLEQCNISLLLVYMCFFWKWNLQTADTVQL